MYVPGKFYNRQQNIEEIVPNPTTVSENMGTSLSARQQEESQREGKY